MRRMSCTLRWTQLPYVSDFFITNISTHSSPLFIKSPVVSRIQKQQERPLPRHCSPYCTNVKCTSVWCYSCKQKYPTLQQRSIHWRYSSSSLIAHMKYCSAFKTKQNNAKYFRMPRRFVQQQSWQSGKVRRPRSYLRGFMGSNPQNWIEVFVECHYQ